jgi:excisionase family DNA binding protein
MSDIKVYGLDEVAAILKVTKRTLYTYVKEDKLHAVKIGKYWRVPEDSLKEFISTGTDVLEGNRRKKKQPRVKGSTSGSRH